MLIFHVFFIALWVVLDPEMCLTQFELALSNACFVGLLAHLPESPFYLEKAHGGRRSSSTRVNNGERGNDLRQEYPSVARESGTGPSRGPDTQRISARLTQSTPIGNASFKISRKTCYYKRYSVNESASLILIYIVLTVLLLLLLNHYFFRHIYS